MGKCNSYYCRKAHEDKDAEIDRLQAAIRAIQIATVEGRVCDDVAWFDTITTLHDFCDHTLNPGGGHEQEAQSFIPHNAIRNE